jgi:hypothetical protein
MKEEIMETIASEIWEKAHQENLHQHINRITGKSFRSTNTCIIYVITENPEAVESLIIEVAESWDAELSKYEDGWELLFY